MSHDARFGVPNRDQVMDLAGRLKRSDVDELWAAAAVTPEVAMAKMYDDRASMTGVWIDGRLEMLFGVNSRDYPDGMAAVWMVSSPVLLRHAKSLVKLGRKWLDEVQHHGLLFNFVDARAGTTLRWLARMGFEFQDIQSFGVHGLPFVMVTRGEQNVFQQSA